MSEKLWQKLGRSIINAGNLPMPVSNTLVELLKLIVTEDQANFIVKVFKKPSVNLEQLEQNTELRGAALDKMLDDLMNAGVISGTQSRRTGAQVYRLLEPFPGMFEFQLMRPGESEREKKLAATFDKLFEEMGQATQKIYDSFVPQVKNYPPIDRTIPVERELKDVGEKILPLEDIRKIVESNDDIALALCYCRHEKDLLNEPCKLNGPRKNCFLFGKTAKFCIEHKFADPVSKEEALKIMREAETFGLVHKVMHVGSDINREVNAVCNCCNCCCGIFQLYRRGVLPFYTTTSYIAKISEQDCTNCGSCVEKCPMEALSQGDTTTVLDTERCIGCGVCTEVCPQDPKGIKLERTGPRTVFVPPPRRSTPN
jgi:Pyruvate/2-oxoacid:ferredoxin oxidoreductase delta subunit